MCDIWFFWGGIFFPHMHLYPPFFSPFVYIHVALSPAEGSSVAGDAGERSAEFEGNLEVLDVIASFFDIVRLPSFDGFI